MNEVAKIERGQVWYIQENNAVGSEEKVGRPVVIVSSKRGCSTSSVLNGVYTTTSWRTGSINVELKSLNRKSYAMCNQIVTLDKKRLTTKLGKVSDVELQAIDAALVEALGLDNGANDELREKVEELEFEIAIHKRLYEKAIDRLAEYKFTKDTPKIPEKSMVEEKKFPEVELDLSELQKKFSVHDAKNKLKIEKVERVNVNTASAKEIAAKTGMSLTVAYSITGTRKEIGPFETLNDLLLCDRFKQSHLDRFGELLEV